jgi:hypothetical protein
MVVLTLRYMLSLRRELYAAINRPGGLLLASVSVVR